MVRRAQTKKKEKKKNNSSATQKSVSVEGGEGVRRRRGVTLEDIREKKRGRADKILQSVWRASATVLPAS